MCDRSASTVQIDVNTPKVEGQYLDGLNQCFGNYGDQSVFDWVFKREVTPDPAPTMLALEKGGVLVAGSAVSYRTIGMPCGCTARAGIMTSSWTIPEERGRGYFRSLICQSQLATRQHGGIMLMAFVSEANSSARQLRYAGATMTPSFYLRSVACEGACAAAHQEISEVTAECIFANLENWSKVRSQCLHFFYANARAWAEQFVYRPWPLKLLSIGPECFAVLEQHDDTDRINTIITKSQSERMDVIKALLARNSSLGRKLFLYSTRQSEAAQCVELGFELIPGSIAMFSLMGSDDSNPPSRKAPPLNCLATLVTNKSNSTTDLWSLESGDRL